MENPTEFHEIKTSNTHKICATLIESNYIILSPSGEEGCYSVANSQKYFYIGFYFAGGVESRCNIFAACLGIRTLLLGRIKALSIATFC